ncbi:MAG: threonine/serine dehydratase [Proteobacteria bacterium]|nr:threonine/serine dehydratase [Pseudomonadota bacterium]
MVDLDDIKAAAIRLKPIIVRTPLISSPALNEMVGGKVLIKAENLQRIGSFKIRGAYNLLSQLTPEQAARGVIAFSSGNHAQAVAAAGTILSIETTIVMPEDAPRIKIENTRKLGGTTVLYDRYTGDRETIARAMAAERGCEVVPSYDHEHIIAGQGTVGLEIVEQCKEAGVVPDQVLINCSGGGLTAGCAIAICSQLANTAVHPVEPEQYDDTCRSLVSGKREQVDVTARSICDSLQVATPGKITFSINKDLLSSGVLVSDDDVRDAIRFAFAHLKLVVEPGGAVSLAAVLKGKIDTREKVTVIVLSGGNIDAEMFASIQASGS